MIKQNPQAVYIQTRTDCNNFCSICPQEKAFNKFGLQKMTKKLFDKIIFDLVEQDYEGLIGIFLQQEPLLDDRLFEFIEMANSSKASVEISTNGILLKDNMEKLKASSVDRIYFNYGAIKHGKTPASIINYVNELAKYKRVIVNYPVLSNENIKGLFPKCYVENFWASNRGDNVKSVCHTNKTKFADRNCQQLNIVANGDVILCCNDYMRENVFGNAKDENVIDIWREIPKHFDYPICQKCI